MEQADLLQREVPEFNSFSELLDYASEKFGTGKAYSYYSDGEIRDISYNQFKEDVRGLASLLADRGYERKKIAILSNNTYEYITVFLAVICSGNTVVPINKDIDRGTLAVIFNDCHPELILFSETVNVSREDIQTAAGVSELMDISEFVAEGKENGLPEPEKELLQWGTAVDDLPCCIVYTSGTSGTPKGVMLSQGNILSNASSFARRMHLQGTLLLCLPLHHMYVWTTSILMPVIYGLHVVVNSDSSSFIRDLKMFSPDCFMVVPAMLEFFYKRIMHFIRKSDDAGYYLSLLKNDEILEKTPEERRRIFSEFTSDLGSGLTQAVCGAAMLDKELVYFFRKIGVEVYGGYGMTECSPVISTNYRDCNCVGSVGRPIDCNEVRINNPDGDGAGEIYIKGPNVMQGYYLRPSETAEVFDGEWLKSGDLGYIDEQGCLYIRGRLKNLIIRSSGENLSPEELELSIMNIANVEEVLVSEAGGLVVARIYVVNSSEELEKQIKCDVSEMNLSMPAYKRVDRVEFVKKPFEKTSTNKIKRCQP